MNKTSEQKARDNIDRMLERSGWAVVDKNAINWSLGLGIACFFKEIGRADELGSGVRNLFKYCRHYSGGKTPELIEGDIFKCIVPFTPEATPQATPQAERVEQICKFHNLRQA